MIPVNMWKAPQVFCREPHGANDFRWPNVHIAENSVPRTPLRQKHTNSSTTLNRKSIFFAEDVHSSCMECGGLVYPEPAEGPPLLRSMQPSRQTLRYRCTGALQRVPVPEGQLKISYA